MVGSKLRDFAQPHSVKILPNLIDYWKQDEKKAVIDAATNGPYSTSGPILHWASDQHSATVKGVFTGTEHFRLRFFVTWDYHHRTHNDVALAITKWATLAPEFIAFVEGTRRMQSWLGGPFSSSQFRSKAVDHVVDLENSEFYASVLRQSARDIAVHHWLQKGEGAHDEPTQECMERTASELLRECLSVKFDKKTRWMKAYESVSEAARTFVERSVVMWIVRMSMDQTPSETRTVKDDDVKEDEHAGLIAKAAKLFLNPTPVEHGWSLNKDAYHGLQFLADILRIPAKERAHRQKMENGNLSVSDSSATNDDPMNDFPEDAEKLGPGGKPPLGPSIWFPEDLLRDHVSLRRINWRAVNVDAIDGWYRTAGVLFGTIKRVTGFASLRWGLTKIDSLRGNRWVVTKGAQAMVTKAFFVTVSLVAQRVRSHMPVICPGMWRFLGYEDK